MIIWQVYRTTYEEFIAPDTDFFLKKQLVRTDCSEAVLISFFALCSLEPMFHFYCSSMGGDADSLTQGRQDTNHPSQNTQSHTFTPLSALLCDQHTSMYALWSEVEKMALNQRTTNHRQAIQFQQSLVSTCRHTYAYTQLRRSFLVYVLINACS